MSVTVVALPEIVTTGSTPKVSFAISVTVTISPVFDASVLALFEAMLRAVIPGSVLSKLTEVPSSVPAVPALPAISLYVILIDTIPSVSVFLIS